MHDVAIGIAVVLMLMLPSVIAFRSGQLNAQDDGGTLRPLSDRQQQPHARALHP